MKVIQKIPLEQIDLSDETFSINFMPDILRLRSSVEAIGLIQPVLLKRKQDRFQIVSGFRRISVFRELGNPDIESEVLKEGEPDDTGLFLIALHENLATRGFNTVEKAIVLDKLIHYFQIDPTIVIKTFLPLLSLEPHEKILKTFLSLARMEDEVKRYVIREQVSRSNIRMLSRFTSEDRLVLLSLFSSLKLGENRLREILTLLEEISRRDRIMIKDIIHRPEIQAIVSQKELTVSQKTERVKKVIMDLRYPRMCEMEEEFRKKRKNLCLPPYISLRHPPFFEGEGLKIEFQFETMEEYRSILSCLSQIADKKDFQKMFIK